MPSYWLVKSEPAKYGFSDLQREGTYNRRYSCRLRRLISEALNQPAPTCAEAD